MNRRLDHPSRAPNEDTLFLTRLSSPWADGSPLRHAGEFYDSIRSWIFRCRAPGLAVAVVDSAGIQARAYLRAKTSGINTAIVGRHQNAEIRLPSDPGVSLRHLALIVHPASSNDEVRFRILDLRTAGGFTDARGNGRRAIEADRPYAAVCGEYVLVFAPVTDPPSNWPSEPQRFEEMFDFDVLTNPETLDGLAMGAREEPLGELIVSSHKGTGAVPVSRRSVGSGILLGRSDRCDGDDLLLDHHISRVHLLIVEIAGKIYAIDTASKNGVFGKAEPERTLPLDSGTMLSLAGFATVEWRFFH